MTTKKIEQEVTQELGYVSALFMTQECKGTEIVMPTKELKEASDRISLYVSSLIQQALAEERERVLGIIKSNSKGAFTDDGGNNCWYVDDLLASLQDNPDKE